VDVVVIAEARTEGSDGVKDTWVAVRFEQFVGVTVPVHEAVPSANTGVAPVGVTAKLKVHPVAAVVTVSSASAGVLKTPLNTVSMIAATIARNTVELRLMVWALDVVVM
jgi:hypothetical protein